MKNGKTKWRINIPEARLEGWKQMVDGYNIPASLKSTCMKVFDKPKLDGWTKKKLEQIYWKELGGADIMDELILVLLTDANSDRNNKRMNRFVLVWLLTLAGLGTAAALLALDLKNRWVPFLQNQQKQRLEAEIKEEFYRNHGRTPEKGELRGLKEEFYRMHRWPSYWAPSKDNIDTDASLQKQFDYFVKLCRGSR